MSTTPRSPITVQPAGTPAKGGVLAALRRSPLVGISLDLSRARQDGRPLRLDTDSESKPPAAAPPR